jgi:hypothetical protein
MAVLSRNFASGCPTTIPVSVGYGILVFSDLLAWPGTQPCVARGAKRLGRSAGPGQRRAPRRGGQLGGSLLHLRAGRFMPRMAGRRRPLPFLHRNRHPWGRRAGCCLQPLRPYWRGNLPPAQCTPSRLDAHPAVPPLTYPHFAPRGHDVPALRFQLEKAVVVPHHPIVTDRTVNPPPS